MTFTKIPSNFTGEVLDVGEKFGEKTFVRTGVIPMVVMVHQSWSATGGG